MKKFLFICFLSAFAMACNDDAATTDNELMDTSATPIDPQETLPDSATIVKDSVVMPLNTHTDSATHH